MSEKEKYQIAKEYVDKQLETMRQNGSAPPTLTDGQYDTLVRQIAQNVKG